MKRAHLGFSAALIVVSMLALAPLQGIVQVSATSKTYDWLNIELGNRSEMMVGPFRLVGRISAGVTDIFMIEVWKGEDVCAVFQASNNQEEVQGAVKAYCGEGPTVFEIHLYGTESTTSDGGKIKFDIKDSVYSPEITLRLHPITPTDLRFNQTSTVVDLTVALRNEATGTPAWARITAAYGRVEGAENATIELVATLPPAENPTNFSVPPPKPGEEANYTFEFSASANGKAYAKLVATIGVSYPVDFKKDEQQSSSSREVWVYDPGRVLSHTVRFYISVGDIYRDVGVPEVRINLNHSALTVQPGDKVSFEFTLKNSGTGDAFNVSIWLSVQPPLPQILVVSPEVPGLTGKPFTGSMTTPMLVPRLPKNAVTQKIKFKVVFPEDVDIMGSYFNTTILVEWQDKVGKNFNAKASRVIIVSEPEYPSISVSKKVSPSEVSVNGTVSVIVKVVNEGEAAATDVKITDSFPEEYFELVQGRTSASASTLAPGKSMTLSYKLRAKKEGSAMLPAAEVQYREREAPQLKYSNTLIVRIVKPSVGLELITSPPGRMIVGDLAEVVFSLANDGTGQAREVEIILEIPPGLDLLEAEGPVTTQERTEEGGWRVSFRADAVDPGASVDFSMRMRVQRMGAYNITLVNATFKGEAGEQKYRVEGAEALELSFLVEVPRSQKVIVTAALVGMVGAVAAASFFAVRGMPSRYATRRPRLGLPR